MMLIASTAIVILLLICILFLITKIYLQMSHSESPKTFVLEKHCNKDELLRICKKKGLTDFDTGLLCAKYAECLNTAQLEIKYSQSIRNIQRLIKEATDKFNS